MRWDFRGLLHEEESIFEVTIFLGDKSPLAEELLEPTSDLKDKLEKVRNMVLYRYGSTGCHEAIAMVVQRKSLIPIYPVASLTTFAANDESSLDMNLSSIHVLHWCSVSGKEGAFRDCVLLPTQAPIRKIARAVGIDKIPSGAIAEDGLQFGAGELITPKNNVLKLTFPGVF